MLSARVSRPPADASVIDALPFPGPGEPYGRQLLVADAHQETLVMTWRPGATCAPHDHGETSSGTIHVLHGTFIERRFVLKGGALEPLSETRVSAPALLSIPAGVIHDMQLAPGDSQHDAFGLTVHVYRPRIEHMRVYDTAARETLIVVDDQGAWVPTDEARIIAREPW